MADANDIDVWPCDREDLGTQKCRLGPALMETLKLAIGDCVQIGCQDQVLMCKVWPRKDGWNHSVQFDSTVCHSLSLFNAASSPKCSTSSFKRKDTVKISSLEVSVVFTHLKDALHFKRGQSQGPGSPSVVKNITEILKRYVVQNDMYVDCKNIALGKLYGISYIHIERTKSSHNETVCGTVSSQTNVLIVSAMSLERFEMSLNKISIPLGGLQSQMTSLNEILSYFELDSKWVESLGISWPIGVLVHGPPGSGKTSLVRKCVLNGNFNLVESRCSETLGNRPGEGEEKLRKIFQKATSLSEEAPCVVLFEDIESICPNQSKISSSSEKRMATQLASLLDNIGIRSNMLVIATSSKPQRVDQTLLTSGRLEKEIFLGIPSCAQRKDILSVLLTGYKVEPDVDLDHLAEASPGFVGADLKSLIDQAHYLSVTDTAADLMIKSDHLEKALHSIVPSSQRGSDVIVDHLPVSWNDIGGLGGVIKQIKQAVEWPLKHPEAFSRLGIPRPSGLLLYGPPGCAKTLLVRAAASACGVTFMAMSGAQLNSPFVGDAEKKLSDVFRLARENAPAILFLDEVDAVVGKRKEGKAHAGAHERVLSTLLNEMDGVGIRLSDVVRNRNESKLLEGQTVDPTLQSQGESTDVDNGGVLVVAATNRPDMIDAALLRPGRFDKLILVPPPDAEARAKILDVHTRKMPLDGVDFVGLSKATEGFTGADIENLCREAALHAMTIRGLDVQYVTSEDFQVVLSKLKPSLTYEQLDFYAKLLER